jgi:hypothetical protein
MRQANERYICFAGGVPQLGAAEPCCCEELLLSTNLGSSRGCVHSAAHTVLSTGDGARVLALQPDGLLTATRDACGSHGCGPAAALGVALRAFGAVLFRAQRPRVTPLHSWS